MSTYTPNFISLQETHRQSTFTPIPPHNYVAYFQNSPLNDYAKQGVGVLIKKNIPHKICTINTPLQIVAIEINLNVTFTIISVYIPPS